MKNVCDLSVNKTNKDHAEKKSIVNAPLGCGLDHLELEKKFRQK